IYNNLVFPSMYFSENSVRISFLLVFPILFLANRLIRKSRLSDSSDHKARNRMPVTLTANE
ncbi:hypothetical protein, partial [Peribacillus frigoritolerans]|uniref:hypothetical protein n=1 Tax=Peribacillus frigoritolerans TaxID=450367 RepID=UPI0036357B6F